VHAIEDASEARERGLGGCTLHASEQKRRAGGLDHSLIPLPQTCPGGHGDGDEY
jgi:hypothetical protein